MTKQLTMTPADVLKYQNDLIRTGKFFPLGRMQKIAIGPAASYTPPSSDPIIRKFGRLIELRDRMLPIGQSEDRSMILITAPLLDAAGRVSLPDLPDPEWTPPPPSREEIEGFKVKKVVDGVEREVTEFPKGNSERYAPRMVPQRLRDRTNEKLEGSNFLIFSPVLTISFQPEIQKRLVGDAWLIRCSYSRMDDTHPTLLIDEATGESHFFGGLYEVVGNAQR